MHSAGLPDCLHIWVPAQTTVPIWVRLELSGICQLHTGLRPPRVYAPAMSISRPTWWERKPYSLLLATASCEAGFCHSVWGMCNLRSYTRALKMVRLCVRTWEGSGRKQSHSSLLAWKGWETPWKIGEISGSRGNEYEETFLGCCTM
jgi:hypothetical protein